MVGKAVVLGMVAKGGELRAGVLDEVHSGTMQSVIYSHVVGGSRLGPKR